MTDNSGPSALDALFANIEYLPEVEGPYKLRAPTHLYEDISKLTDERFNDSEENAIFARDFMVDFKSMNEDPAAAFFYMGSRSEEGWSEILRFFRKSGDEAAMNGHIHPKVLGSRHGQDEPRLKYPFHTLRNIGDYFFVKGGKRETIAVYASNYTKYMAPQKIISVRNIPNGVLVILLWDNHLSINSIDPSKVISE